MMGLAGLWSPEDALFYRDETYFNKTTSHGKKVFWGAHIHGAAAVAGNVQEGGQWKRNPGAEVGQEVERGGRKGKGLTVWGNASG